MWIYLSRWSSNPDSLKSLHVRFVSESIIKPFGKCHLPQALQCVTQKHLLYWEEGEKIDPDQK